MVLILLSLNACNKSNRFEKLKPNILWLVSEDNSPFLGCYGDSLAFTPNLDKLASMGVRYTGAYANAPVCSAARSTLISGMYGIRLGIYHHRSAHPIPQSFKPYPIYFREAGYYCTNNAKKDYNLVNDYDCWDESSREAHYKNRNPGQPFFAIFNIGESHESSTFPRTVTQRRESRAYPPESRLRPEQVILPPYHPDLPEIRQEWADYYDAVTLMDEKVGERLKEMEEAGLTDSTIVVYYSDHGGGMARGKRSVKESGTHVPMIIYFPEMYRQLAPAGSGETVDRLVSFVDLPATMLSIMGAEIPGHMDGEPFLGERQTKPRDHVFLYRGRMDSRYDFVRAVKTDKYRYIRNYTLYRPYGQPYIYAENARTTPLWRKTWQEGKCDSIQSIYWELKPGEELYDVEKDPHEVNNLVNDPDYADQLSQMRNICNREIISNRDVGFIPESIYSVFAGDSTIYNYAQSEKYDLEGIMEVADMAIKKDPGNLNSLIVKMSDPDPIIRYWAALGAVILRGKALDAREKLIDLIKDEYPEVRIAAAEALAYIGEQELAVEVLKNELRFDENKDKYVYVYAANALQYIDKEYVNPLVPFLEKIAEDERYDYACRTTGYLSKELRDE
ncbi:MAG TPA: sulfatase [Bacteroidales bacterium]|nr:sulfatase [Bacteroidales bacterium]